MEAIKRLLPALKGYWHYALWTPVLVIGGAAVELAGPWLLARMIDEGVTPGDLSKIYFYAALLIGATLVSLCLAVGGAITGAKAAAGLAKNLRTMIFEQIEEFSFTDIDKFSPASLITRLTTDVNNVQNSFSMILRMAIRAPATLIIAFAIALKINASLSLLFLAIAPVILLGMYLISTHAHPIFKKLFKLYDKLNLIIQENIRGIRVVKTYVREEHEIAKFEVASAEIYETFSKAEKILSFTSPLMEATTYTLILLICWFGAQHIVINGDLSTGDLISLVSYATNILFALVMISIVMVMLTMSKTAVDRINEVLSEASDLQNPSAPLTEVSDGEVVFDHVYFSYTTGQEHNCLCDINLHFSSGQTIGILGGTGSGKSSLVQLIPRLYDVTAGSVKIAGYDVRAYDLDTLHRSVAMVLQKNVLFSGTIAENLRWGNPDASQRDLEKACRQAQIHDFISQLSDGYQTLVEQGGTNFSGGQKQRLCIARALVAKPKVLILDDSTSAVDTRTENSIRQAWQTEIPETTVIVIAQRVLSVMQADQIVVLDRGSVADVGTHDELMARCQIYQEVYCSQIKEEA